ncbi:hypothetical protein COLO4_29266 [Corchorus olitorius]|uniref:Uncharacterized protein n=1 Tax=Corchorus olitorius TaxID=93759 RepID=A0A1R3HFM9_9ROSI|nr:hypothetical protein COLO4_29266 [Corchorus olitorius]
MAIKFSNPFHEPFLSQRLFPLKVHSLSTLSTPNRP